MRLFRVVIVGKSPALVSTFVKNIDHRVEKMLFSDRAERGGSGSILSLCNDLLPWLRKLDVLWVVFTDAVHPSPDEHRESLSGESDPPVSSSRLVSRLLSVLQDAVVHQESFGAGEAEMVCYSVVSVSFLSDILLLLYFTVSLVLEVSRWVKCHVNRWSM